MAEYTITVENRDKTRAFSAHLAAVIVRGESERPVWATWAESEQQLRPFMANLRMGQRADLTGRYRSTERYSFLKSLPWRVTWQREAEGSLATIFMPGLFTIDQTMADVDEINFVSLMPEWWVASQNSLKLSAEDVEYLQGIKYLNADVLEALPRLVHTASLFHLFVDRRTRCPLIQDLRFSVQLLIGALENGLASLPGTNLAYFSSRSWGVHSHHKFAAEGLSDVGIASAISFEASHAVFEEFLAEQVELYFSERVSPREKLAKVKSGAMEWQIQP